MDVPLFSALLKQLGPRLLPHCLLPGSWLSAHGMVSAAGPCCISVVCSDEGPWMRWTMDKKDHVHTVGKSWVPASDREQKRSRFGWTDDWK